MSNIGKNHHQLKPKELPKSKCCGCRPWSWLSYILIMISLTLSIMVFWMNLYRHQEIMMEMEKFRKNSTIQDGLEGRRGFPPGLRSAVDTNAEKIDLVTSDLETLKKELMDKNQEDKVQWGRNEIRLMQWVEDKIKGIRTTYGNIINSITVKLSGWESANGVTLKALNRLKTHLNDLDSTTSGLKHDLNNLSNDLVHLEKQMNRMHHQFNSSKSYHENIIDKMRGQILDELISKENSSSSFKLKAEKRFSELQNKTVLLSQEIAGMKLSVSQEMKETSGDITKLVAEEFDRWSERLGQDMESKLANATQFAKEENVKLQKSISEATSDSSRAIEALKQRLTDFSLQAQLLSLEQKQNEAQISDVEQILQTQLQQQMEQNKEELDLLVEKVEHFVQSLLKVKTLPAVVNAMGRRIEILDENLTKVVALVDDDQAAFILRQSLNETVTV